MNIRRMRLRDLKPARYNPRRDLKPGDRRYQDIKASLERFGLVETMVYNERSGNLVGGHQRLKVLMAEGVEEEDVSIVDLDEQDEIALNLALNNIDGEWDQDLLRAVLGDMEDLTGTGFAQEDQDAAAAAAEAEHIGEGAGQPTDDQLRRVTLAFTVSGHTGYCCMAVNAGLGYGTQSGRSVCGNTAPGRAHAVVFMDNDYFRYDHQVHLAAVEAHRPRYATVRDLMTVKQCEAAGIEHFDFDQVMHFAEDLEEAGAEHVIVIPKYDCLADIPERFVLGYSIPTSHGGTPVPYSRFKGRPIHLLGGSPQKQWAYFCTAPDDVVSIDNNYILRMSTFGQWFNVETMAFEYIGLTSSKPKSAMMAALTLSAVNMAELFRHELHEGEFIDRLTLELSANPSPLSRTVLAALGLSLSNVAQLFHREPIDIALRDLAAAAQESV